MPSRIFLFFLPPTERTTLSFLPALTAWCGSSSSSGTQSRWRGRSGRVSTLSPRTWWRSSPKWWWRSLPAWWVGGWSKSEALAQAGIEFFTHNQKPLALWKSCRTWRNEDCFCSVCILFVWCVCVFVLFSFFFLKIVEIQICSYPRLLGGVSCKRMSCYLKWVKHRNMVKIMDLCKEGSLGFFSFFSFFQKELFMFPPTRLFTYFLLGLKKIISLTVQHTFLNTYELMLDKARKCGGGLFGFSTFKTCQNIPLFSMMSELVWNCHQNFYISVYRSRIARS